MNKYNDYKEYYIDHNGYSSNQIEDKGLTYEYYKKIIQSAKDKIEISDLDKTDRDQEVLNFYNASQLIFNDEKKDFLSLSKTINKILLYKMAKYYGNNAPINDISTILGEYRKVDMTKGRNEDKIAFYPCKKIPEALEETFLNTEKVLNDDKFTLLDKFKAIVLFHLNFERVHPFPEGNGRTGRLIMDKMLFSIGLPSLCYEDKTNNEYSKQMNKVQTDLTNLTNLETLFKRVPDTFLAYSVDCFKRECSNLYRLGFVNDFSNVVKLLDEIGD